MEGRAHGSAGRPLPVDCGQAGVGERFVVKVQVASTGELSAAEMTRIAESIEVLDESTWLPATEALAGR